MTEPRTRRGDGYASTGAVRQHAGKLPIYVCTTCGAEVVWVESTRTGRPYLVTVSKGYLGQRYYVGANVHPRDCGERRARELAEAAERPPQPRPTITVWQPYASLIMHGIDRCNQDFA